MLGRGPLRKLACCHLKRCLLHLRNRLRRRSGTPSPLGRVALLRRRGCTFFFTDAAHSRCRHQESDGTEGGGKFATAAAAAAWEAKWMLAPAVCDGDSMVAARDRAGLGFSLPGVGRSHQHVKIHRTFA